MDAAVAAKRKVRGSARELKTVGRNVVNHVCHGGSFSRSEKEMFGPVLETWRPEHGRPADIMRWIVSEWCNFNCAYCHQTHGRRASKGNGLTAHAFDNFPLEKWIDKFHAHFSHRRLTLVITGGEPMLDTANMTAFLNYLDAVPWCSSIRIDTNGSWIPQKFKTLKKDKISLNCSYHPTQIKEDKYFANLEAIKNAGFRIGMVNYVLVRTQWEEFKRFQAKVEALGLVMNVSPEFKERLTFTEREMESLEMEIIPKHLPFRIAATSPLGKPCLYPTISYEMDATGHVRPGCMPHMGGSFFDAQLPYYGNRTASCPFKVCSCLDKYSFLAEFDTNVTTDPFTTYTNQLRDLSAKRRAHENPSAAS
jgi:organic radical activating enzyme